MIKLGEKIKSLRKQKNISQEVFAGYLGVSFQAVSKWENGNTMPDVTMIPAIASFFGVSTDELFDFNLYEMEKQVEEICLEAYRFRFTDAAKSEKILRDGLQRFPGNDIILNNLLYTLDYQTRADEVITLCKTLIESTKDDSVKYDACRILALSNVLGKHIKLCFGRNRHNVSRRRRFGAVKRFGHRDGFLCARTKRKHTGKDHNENEKHARE